MNCLHSFRTDKALKKHESLCENNDYSSVEIPTKINKILKYNHGEKSLKTPFVIYVDLECLLLNQQSRQNNPNEAYTERKAIYELCGYSFSLFIWFSFYRGNNCIKKFCSELKELGTKLVNYEQKEMAPLIDDENRYYEEQKECYICRKVFCYNKKQKKRFKLYKKLDIIVILQEHLAELLIAFVIYTIEYAEKFLWKFIIVQNMITAS